MQRHGPPSEVGEDYDENSDSSYNETSRLKLTKKTRKTRQPTSSTHRTRKRGHEDDSSTVVNSVSGHSASMHVITTVEPMRIALLEWYDSVHDARRMPWRKKFDPSLDVEGRAQRAYEVGSFSSIKKKLHLGVHSCRLLLGLGIGNHATADSSRDGDTIL